MVILGHRGVFGIEPDPDIVIDTHLLCDITRECHDREQHGGDKQRECGNQIENFLEHTITKLA